MGNRNEKKKKTPQIKCKIKDSMQHSTSLHAAKIKMMTLVLVKRFIYRVSEIVLVSRRHLHADKMLTLLS